MAHILSSALSSTDSYKGYHAGLLSCLKERLEKAVSQNSYGTLHTIAINDFATLISWHGIAKTDQIMDDVEAHIARELQPGELIFRTGMDEFAVVLDGTKRRHKALFPQNLLKSIMQYQNPLIEEGIRISVTIGSADFPDSATFPTDVIAKAYIALQAARSTEGMFYCDYTEAEKQQLHAKNQSLLLRYLQDAVQQNRLRLAFQPIVATGSGVTEFYECLLRVVGEDGKISSAGTFIPIAEKMGFVDIIDRLVLEKVVEELNASPDVRLSFNLSNRTTDDLRWLEQCATLLHEYDVSDRIIVEITETAAQRDLRETAYFVASLQALGCSVALDDFCAGYTSFRQLRTLSVDMIKIDGSFTKDIVDNSDNRLFVKTLLDFTNAYGLKTIAECVEDGNAAKILMDMGVDYLQGYYFGKPEVTRDWLKEKEPMAIQLPLV